MDWGEHDGPPWSSFGQLLEHDGRLTGDIVAALPAAEDRDDGIDRVLAIYRWLDFSGATSAQIHCGWQGDWAVSLRQEVNLGVGGVHQLMQELARSTPGLDPVAQSWMALSTRQSQRALRQARPRGVAKWMALLHQAEQQAMSRHGASWAVKIYPTGAGATRTDMWVMPLKDYLAEPVERRRQHVHTTFHVPDAAWVADMQAHELDGDTSHCCAKADARRL